MHLGIHLEKGFDMAKRFTDTEIWQEDWFLDLSIEEKLFWFYLKDVCDHSGFWRVNRKRFEYIVGKKFSLEQFFETANRDKIRIIPYGERWYLKTFIKFQYGQTLNPTNRLHESIIKNLNLYVSDGNDLEVILTSFRPQIEVKDRVKEKDKEKEKEIGKEGLEEKPKEKISKIIEPVHPLQEWIKQNCPRVAKLDKQLTYEEAEKIAAEFDREQIINKLLAMENKRKLDYVSVNLTLRNWLIKDQNNPAIPGFSNYQTETKINPRSRP
jgi:hypothetical protein